MILKRYQHLKKVAILLGLILSIFVSYHIFPLYESCVGITTKKAVNNFKYSDALPLVRESEHKS